jgi:hypothetical protein
MDSLFVYRRGAKTGEGLQGIGSTTVEMRRWEMDFGGRKKHWDMSFASRISYGHLINVLPRGYIIEPDIIYYKDMSIEHS